MYDIPAQMGKGWMRITSIVAIVAILSSNLTGTSMVFAQSGNETPSRGVFGDALDMLRLHGLIKNMYEFKERVFVRGGFEANFLSWVISLYSGFSKIVLGSPIGIAIKTIALPFALITSICLPLYPQLGMLGVVLAICFLTGLVYAFPLFLIVEAFSKVGLITIYGKSMLIALLMLAAISTLSMLYGYGYYNVQAFFASCLLMLITTWFAWFLPIFLYYRS